MEAIVHSRTGASTFRRIFWGPQGLRAGWSLAIFFTFYSVLTLGTQFGFAVVPALRAWVAAQPHEVITALGQIEFTGLELLILLISVAFVSMVERRFFRDYGLSKTRLAAKHFPLGLALGFGMASVLTGLIALFGGYSVQGLALRAPEILPKALMYGVSFLIVGFFEEFAFRGYLQATLQRGIGFWPAAVILSLAFGAMHLPNVGGVWLAAVTAAGYGLVAALALKRTGALWFIIGVHSAFDWSNTFVYSSPITGLRAEGCLLKATLQGPVWLTGGHAGPVGSVFAPLVIALAGLVIYFAFPQPARQTS
jgi:hypothetical protein